MVRKLADQQAVNLNNLSPGTNGHNVLEWDGKDKYGKIVDPGSYTITLFAEDNAGLGANQR